jgi:acyl-CoA synthetase (AMP-forming)/AMP-acid ligase II/ankyrin repeat protein
MFLDKLRFCFFKSFQMAMSERWEQRPAIIWNIPTPRGGKMNHGNSSCSSANYWDINPLSDHSIGQSTDNAFITTISNDVDPTGDTHVGSLSYREVLQCTQIIFDHVRQKIQSELMENCHRLDIPPQNAQSTAAAASATSTKSESVLSESTTTTRMDPVVIPIPVAVAIPEGPWLVLAVTAVHALNKPFPVTYNNTEHDSALLCLASVVLVPLEPTEGTDRLMSMLGDARPLIIMTASDRDYQGIANILTSMETTPNMSKDTPLYQTNHIQIIDVRSVFPKDKGIEGAKMTLLSISSTESMNFMDALELWCSSGTLEIEMDRDSQYIRNSPRYNRISHVVFTSGTTGRPKGCVSSIRALMHYIRAKNQAHAINENSVVLLASAVSFDPCLSDILATFAAKATLAICPRTAWLEELPYMLQSLHVSHILCTPTVWGNMPGPVQKSDFPHLRVIALGGERIPKRIMREWARSASCVSALTSVDASQQRELRLCATFGVTEACVYQTFGEVFSEALDLPGQNVGTALQGMDCRICREDRQDQLINVEGNDYPECVGEIVLSGKQIDELSCYLKRPDLTKAKFVVQENQTFYRTGDRGYVRRGDKESLYVLGRIAGEDGMVKFNGVRVELGEIEAAIVDDNGQAVADAIVVARFEDDAKESSVARELHAYLVLSPPCQNELGLLELSESGVLCTEGPLLLLLRERCKRKSRVVPSAFVLVPRIPLSPTGKRSRRSAPSLADSVPFISLLEPDVTSLPLSQYGEVGKFVADSIRDCLNLQPSQEKFLTTNATFSMLGGDSLAATRIVRAIYANHYQLVDSRFLGGKYGILDGPFAVVHLLKSRNLGEYVDWLNKNGIGETNHDRDSREINQNDVDPDPLQINASGGQGDLPSSSEEAQVYNALLEATMRGQDSIAIGLLDLGVDPNFGAHGGRLAKTSCRLDRKKKFHSSPLHYASLKGSPLLVEKLLEKGAMFNSPDASGLFPIHLAAMGEFHMHRTVNEDRRRRRCVELLIQAGVPLFMKDGSRQTALHTAARGGHCQVLRYLLEKWRGQINADPRRYQSCLDWLDNWSRTPVHWATLHGNVDALALLLEFGCDPNPPKPKAGLSSAAIESPLEICTRVHGDSAVGMEITALLQRQRSNDCK